MTETGKKGISGSTLKLIAVISMLVDHTAAVLVWNPLNPAAQTIVQTMDIGFNLPWISYLFMRYPIGRLAFPIYCFLLVEGFLHTRNVKKYALRLFVFALLSEVPFDLAIFGRAWELGGQNVFFTLFLAVVAMMGMKFLEDKYEQNRCSLFQKRLGQILWVMAVCFVASIIFCDYGAKGVLMVLVLYLFRYDRKAQVFAGSVAFLCLRIHFLL